MRMKVLIHYYHGTINDNHVMENVFMLYWALVFFIVSVIAGLLGFTGVAAASATIAKVFFVIFLFIFLMILLAIGLGRR